MKTPPTVLADVARRLARTWAQHATSSAAGVPAEGLWPHEFAIGNPTQNELERDFPAYVRRVQLWWAWAEEHRVQLRWRTRHVSSTAQQLPTHLVVEDISAAARLAGAPWPERLVRAEHRAAALRDRFDGNPNLERVLSGSVDLNDVDFELLCRAGAWFALNQDSRLTPRQVPIEGMHAKWLNTRQALVKQLAILDDLGLAPRHPSRVHFTYLDPQYRATRGRIHDCISTGDNAHLPYIPRVVLISENKDTAVWFPPVASAIAVEGAGSGAAAFAAVNWIRDAEVLVYWGDMDADGLEILNEFRAAGLPAVPLLMDFETYLRWERYGVNVDAKGKDLTNRPPRPVEQLPAEQRELYFKLIDERWTRVRRVEQERIPLDVARAALIAVVTERRQVSVDA
ncbi:Wadjet anti-phage system protein JetD domain-containing protein [Cellulomonas xiejunii]|uniref:DUF2220 family protein n=1 Tax=Cellulomonas xiejunii TaxID=2968083 RepID=A0ABY5KMW3_9CELL|nr:Wadjet anti-phage system protein JetD domain-containing protein [Cellulomonas xiejunii]MCC2321260.1 DUF2220 family protein [Cellulomonas xiejunii]UUI71847.1 DUF2220 family protein [Cellulomonas xiejunii]